jgi:predicted alpha/beta hydrolase
MHPILMRILTFALTSVAIYFGIAATLIVVGKPRKPHDPEKGLSFDELFFDTSSLPELETFEARDGATLAYRHYPADADTVLILLHGSGWHSSYLLPLAEFVSGENLAHVYTPDLRGHGPSPARRGDIDYIAQLEDDIADLIALIKQQHPDAPMIVGGHSSGGGLALRFAGALSPVQRTHGAPQLWRMGAALHAAHRRQGHRSPRQRGHAGAATGWRA